MAYRLDLTGDVPAAIRRVAEEQLERAVAALGDGSPEDREAALHEVRTRLARTRSLLRLAGPGVRKGRRRREDRALRDAGRTLPTARDAAVAVATMDALHERFAGFEPAAAFDAVRERLAARAGAGAGAAGDELAAQAEALRALRTQAAAWPVDDVDAGALLDGITRIYARGRDAFAEVRAEPSPELVRAWRKRVEDLRHGLELLRDLWPGPVGAAAQEAKALARLLGDDHDLATLGELLREDPELTRDAIAERDRLVDFVELRRGELLEDARRLGARLYAEPPKAFRRRLKAYGRADGER